MRSPSRFGLAFSGFRTLRSPRLRGRRNSSVRPVLIAAYGSFLTAASLVAASSDLVAVRLLFDDHGSRPIERLFLEARTSGDPPTMISKEIALFDVSAEITLDLTAGRAWTLSAKAEGRWFPALAVIPGSADERHLWRGYDAVEARLEVVAPRGDPVPAELRVKVTPSPIAGQAPPFPPETILCPITDRAARCHLPALRLDLRVDAEGWVPQYFFDRSFRVGAPALVTLAAFERGSSISGHVTLARGEAPPAETKVRLTPWQDFATSDGATARRLEALDRETGLDSRGFFFWPGVPPGRYRLIVSAPEFAPAWRGPIDVHPGLEASLIEPVILERPVALEVRVQPALAPDGGPWRIVLERRFAVGAPPEERHEQQVSEAGVSRWTDLTPTGYELLVLDQKGARWFHEPVHVTGSETITEINLPILEVKGTIRLGEELLEGRLTLSSRTDRRRVEAPVVEGAFRALLPGPGRWVPRFTVTAPFEAEITGATIEIEEAGEIEIRFPNTVVRGDVVDPLGNPQQGARVTLAANTDGPGSKFGEMSATTDAQGRFELRAAPPGTATILADAGDRSSEILRIEVTETLSPPRFRLVVRPAGKIEGVVRGDGRPVAGARVTFWPVLAGRAGASLSEAVTDPNGRFELTIEAPAATLGSLVQAPGWATRMAVEGFVEGRELSIDLERAGGFLRVQGLPPSEYGRTFLFHRGVALPIVFLATLLGRVPGEDSWSVGDLAAGSYSVCRGAGVLDAILRGETPAPGACRSGELSAGGVIELDLR